MMKNIIKYCFALLLLSSQISSCINFREWDKENFKESDFNNKGSPIALFTSEPEENINPKEPIGENVLPDEVSFNTQNSKRLLGNLHEIALNRISYSIPTDWTELRKDFFWSPSYSTALHIYTFQPGTSLPETYNEYKSFISQIIEIQSAEAGFYDKFPLDDDSIIGIFGGIYRDSGNDWIGMIFTFQDESYTYLFMWDVMDLQNPKYEDELFSSFDVIDSIRLTD